jgi:RNA polymerase primary sigma factor
VKRGRGRPRIHPPKEKLPPPVAPDGSPLKRRRGRPAREQDHLTWDDINDALPSGFVTPDLMDALLTRLRAMEIKIIDDVDGGRARLRRAGAHRRERDAAPAKLDVFDDPVRMYLRQMGQVPLLTREQEIEDFEAHRKARPQPAQCLHTIGFIGQAYIQYAEALKRRGALRQAS